VNRSAEAAKDEPEPDLADADDAADASAAPRSMFADAVWVLPDWWEKRAAQDADVADDDESPAALLLRAGFFLPDVGQQWTRHPHRDFPLWPENKRAYDFFTQRCVTQWHYAGMDGARVALNMEGVRVIYETVFGKRMSVGFLDDLQLCESAALGAWNDQRKAEAKRKGDAR
jgi:hypothetical protein